MRDRLELDGERMLLAVFVAFVLGWWLAVRTLALRTVGMAEVVTTGPSPSVAGAKPVPAKWSWADRAEDYLTVKELEVHLPLCGKSIRKEIGEGRLPSHRLRGKVTVKGSDALAWLSARKEG